MRWVRKIFGWTLLLVIGFLVGLFFGPQIAEELLPVQETAYIEILENNVETKQVPQIRRRFSDFLSPYPETVNQAAIEHQILERVNYLRSELGLNPVEKNNTLREAASIRAVEIEAVFSHTRPNGQEPFSVLQEVVTDYNYEMVGENLAMATFLHDEEYMSKLIMEGWIESEDHYDTMINPDYQDIGIGVHYDGEILYVTQFFGKQQ